MISTYYKKFPKKKHHKGKALKIFELNSYQEIIDTYVNEQKMLSVKITHQALAEELRIQKSYFSKIMNGKANLSKDQAYLLIKKMQLNKEEARLFYLLVDYEKVAIKELKDEIKSEINKLQRKNTQSEKYLQKELNIIESEDLQKYYLLPENQLIHLAFSLKKYQTQPDLLINDLHISNKVLNDTINLLQKLNLIKVSKNKIDLLKSNLHLPSTSPYFYQWQTLLKTKSNEWCKSINEDDKYNFVASFTANDEEKEKIRLEFMKFLSKVEKIVTKAPSKNLYQLNFDLFKWL